MAYYSQRRPRQRHSNSKKRGRGRGRARGRRTSFRGRGRKRSNSSRRHGYGRGSGRVRGRGKPRRRYNRYSHKGRGRGKSRNYHSYYPNNRNRNEYNDYDNEYYYYEDDGQYYNDQDDEKYEDDAQYVTQYETPGRKRDDAEDDHNINVSLTRVIFVANLNDSIDGDVLNDLFRVFGTIKTSIVKCNRNNESLGHGFVEFESIDSAIKAQNATIVYQGDQLLVGFANDPHITLPHTSEIYFYCEQKQDNKQKNIKKSQPKKGHKKNKSKAEMYYEKQSEKIKQKQLNKALTIDSMYGKLKGNDGNVKKRKYGHKLDKICIDWDQVGVLKDCCKGNYNGCRVHVYGSSEDVKYDRHSEYIKNVRFPLVLFDGMHIEQIKKAKAVIKSILNSNVGIVENVEDKYSVFKHKKAKKKRNEVINRQYASK
eukprot:27808_1